MRATHRKAKTTKGWRKAAPKIPSERRALLARCGKKAFLEPSKLKFPIMPKHGACRPDCEGLRSAFARANQYGHTTIAARARKKAKAARCAWVR
jgi:hypothetical protein